MMMQHSAPDKKELPKMGYRECIQWFLGNRRRFVVRENSMLPTLRPGDTVLAEIGVSIHVGDIAIAMMQLSQATKLMEVIPPELLIIKRVGEIFYDGGVYLISDNAMEPSARDSRHL
ncbi:MAG: hypothetical protein F6K11_16845, partial [Leptolyngbya sp. SIO3F4]|nr:hypothetical protein [Leptolyngbya sp. SIO3F4]